MRGETQANRLERMMQKHHNYPTYTLSLPLFEVKKSSIKKLKKNDLLLVGLEHLDLVLIGEDGACAELSLEDTQSAYRLKILALIEQSPQKESSKKYQTVTVSFGTIQRREIAIGDIIETVEMRFNELSIYTDTKEIAQGSLVKVDGEIAVQIEKVI